MIHFIFDTLYGWWGVAGITVLVCVAVGYFIPSLRLSMIAVGGAAIWLASAFTKGWAAAKRDDRAKTEAAIKKVNEDYDHIETRPDSPDTVADRLRRGNF